jgi:hypothetical protein
MKNTPPSRAVGSVAIGILCTLIGSLLLLTGASRALAATPQSIISLPASLKTLSTPLVAITPMARPVSLPAITPMLAQADPTGPVEKFIHFLSEIFLVIGCIVIAYGGYEISRGRVVEGLMCILGGLILAIAIPLMKWLLQLTAGG